MNVCFKGSKRDLRRTKLIRFPKWHLLYHILALLSSPDLPCCRLFWVRNRMIAYGLFRKQGILIPIYVRLASCGNLWEYASRKSSLTFVSPFFSYEEACHLGEQINERLVRGQHGEDYRTPPTESKLCLEFGFHLTAVLEGP